MGELSVLIGGKGGFGIDRSSIIIAGIMGALGYRLYVYRDYPSIIRGGHTFSMIRASGERIAAHKDKIDALLALNQDTIDIHKGRLKPGGVILYDADAVKQESLPDGVLLVRDDAGNWGGPTMGITHQRGPDYWAKKVLDLSRVSEDDWRSIQETLYLVSIPGMRESIREGLAAPIDECSQEPGW
jgi:hypothetical protein